MSTSPNTGTEPLGLPKEVGRALHALARAARAKHLYRSNNTALKRVLSDVHTLFTELLGKTDEIALRIRPDAFIFDEERVFEDPNPDESIAFAFFRDGIRRIDFARGLTAGELDILIQATASGFAFSGLGDDIVSFLWRHDLEHVHYVVVDTTIVDAGPSGAAPATDASGREIDIDAQIDGLIAAIYGASTEDVGPKSVHVDATDVAAKAIADQLEGVDEMAPGFHPLRQVPRPPTYAADLMLELEAEDEQAVNLRVLYAALEAIALGEDHFDHQSVAQGLIDLFDARLMANDLDGAAQIIASLRGLSDLEHAHARVEALVGEAVSETRLRQVTTAPSARTPEGLRALGALFEACGPRAVPSLLGMIPGLQEPALRRSFVELALRIGVEDLDPVRLLLTSDQTFVADEALFMLAKIGTPEALEILGAAREHPQPGVRAGLAAACDSLPRSLGLELAVALLGDPDPRTVATSARALGRMPSEEAVQAIEGELKKPDLLSRPMEIKVALLEGHAALHGNRALTLLARFLAKGESRSASVEEEDLAIAAARALRTVATPGAVKALKEAAGYWNKRVRDEARQVLLRMAGEQG